MGVYTHSYAVNVLYLTSDWVAVLWIWLEDCVCVCVRQPAGPTTEATAGWNRTRAWAKLDFCGPRSHGPAISMYSVYCMHPVLLSFQCVPTSSCAWDFMCYINVWTRLWWYLCLSSLNTRVGLRLFWVHGLGCFHYWSWRGWRVVALLPRPPQSIWEGLGPEKPQHEPLALTLALSYVTRHAWELLLSHY